MNRSIVAGLLWLLAPTFALADQMVQITVIPTDLGGNPISQISAGSTFKLETIIQDIRTPVPQFSGVFAAYLDASYNPSLALVATNAPISYGPFFTPPLGGTHDFSTPGLIKGTGAAAHSLIGLGSAPALLWSIPITAVQAGLETFTPSYDAAPGHDVLVYGDDNVVPADQIRFVGAGLTIVPEPGGIVLCILGCAGLSIVRYYRGRG